MKNNFKLAIVGASGVVGQKIIQLLEEMALDIGEVFFLGSSSVGKDIFFNNEKFKIQDLESFDPSNVDVSIFSAGSSVAKNLLNLLLTQEAMSLIYLQNFVTTMTNYLLFLK
jgi:aspartate-semialdehyde dehydrogenase